MIIRVLCLLGFLALVISCAGGNGDSPIGNIDEFIEKPLDIYVEIGGEGDDALGLAEDGVPDDINTAAARPVQELPVWDLLVSPNAEKGGYGMYTYVLFGPVPSLKSYLYQEAIERRYSIINAVMASSAGRAGLTEREEANIFYLPAKNDDTGKQFLPDNYDSRLSMGFIADLSDLIIGEEVLVKMFRTHPGPFLISTLKPIGRIKKSNALLLYADLSDTDPETMPDIIAAYQMKMGRELQKDTMKFSFLRLKLFNIIQNVGSRLKIVRVSLDHWIPLRLQGRIRG